MVVEATFDADVVDGVGDGNDEGVRWQFRRPDPAVAALRAVGHLAGDPSPHIRTPGLHLVRAVRSLNAGVGPDLIHSFDLVFYPNLLALSRLARPLLAHFHGGAPARRPGWRVAERLALSKVDRLLFTTVDQAVPWIESGYPGDRVRTILETSVLVPGAVPLGLPGSPALVCVGRLDNVKDPLTVLAGFDRLLKTHPNAVLHLAWTDAPLHAEILARAAAFGPAVRLHGRLLPADAFALIANADALLQASVREVCGVAVLEAMAAGTPPVVTDIPAFTAVLGDCGARFSAGDAEGMARAIRGVLADPTQRTRCRARFDAALSFDALAMELDAIYRELLHP